MALLQLIDQPQRHRLLGGRRLGDLEGDRHLVGGIHHQVQQVAEPLLLLLLVPALHAPISIQIAAPVAVLAVGVLAVSVSGRQCSGRRCLAWQSCSRCGHRSQQFSVK